MASSDIAPVVARIINRLQTVNAVGLVYGYDIYAHNDLAPLIVSDIAGQQTLRAWWITGPTMAGQNMVQKPGGAIERSWLYKVHGITGVVDDGTHIETLRTIALGVSDALDLDVTLNNTCHRTEPCRWQIGPENRTVVAGIGVAYVQIDKPVVTLSTP